ncbi:MAG: 1-acyl-sn-glycerol-3-phosphate acyltransferase [Muribaculaceae bacterium]|nr:1-acyl-sn-glycerol-3-phosphate acyltransferase [Muribaculaceae bacterium]
MSLSRHILGLFGWKVRITVPDYPKVIICVAPHTSNWDFILGKLAYAAVGRKAGFLMKSDWFFFPMGAIFRAMGGIPVNRKGGYNESSVDNIINTFKTHDRLTLAITPEGTRSRTTKWRTGFLNIARLAEVPIVLGAIDAESKTIIIEETFTPTGDNETDLRKIKDYYSQFKGINPENCTTE